MLYFNNAATSYPKAPEVIQAVAAALTQPPRDPYRDGGQGVDPTLLCRRSLAELFGCDHPERVIFTAGATVAINMLLGGLVKPGGHIVTTCTEHNALLRPIFRAQRAGLCSVTLVPSGALGEVTPESIASAMRPDTALVAMACISNVTGWCQDVEGIYARCEQKGVPLLLDAAQFSGSLAVPLRQMPCATLVFAGHKGLGGPSGIGGFILGEGPLPEPWLVGGTGILSDLREMPEELPLRYEPGVPNHAGILGLGAACESLLSFGAGRAANHLKSLVGQLREELGEGGGVGWYTALENPSGIVSLTLPPWSPRDLAYVLEQSHGMVARHGLHCAPLLHRSLGTAPEGTLRLSFSRFTTSEQVHLLARALWELRGAA